MRNLFAVIMLTMSAAAYAHEPMGHACTAPERPANDQDDMQWQRFMQEIDAFRDCVNAKMEWHQSAVYWY